MNGSLQVAIPGSSANLGPGFDSLAVALTLKLTVRVVAESGPKITTKGHGAGEIPTDERNLIWRAAASYCAWAGVELPDVALLAQNEIPLERGLGSSAAAAVAGVVLGQALTGGRGCDDELIAIAADLEGHADNAAAALLGGLVVCREGAATRLEPTDNLQPVAAIPAVRQSTKAARGVLPEQISLADAAANGARTALVVAGLTGLTAWEPRAMQDVLHEPSRLALMEGSGRLVYGLRKAGIGACLSGAGPTVLAVVPARSERALQKLRDLAGDDFEVRPLHWDRAGAVVTRPSGS